MKKLQTLE